MLDNQKGAQKNRLELKKRLELKFIVEEHKKNKNVVFFK